MPSITKADMFQDVDQGLDAMTADIFSDTTSHTFSLKDYPEDPTAEVLPPENIPPLFSHKVERYELIPEEPRSLSEDPLPEIHQEYAPPTPVYKKIIDNTLEGSRLSVGLETGFGAAQHAYEIRSSIGNANINYSNMPFLLGARVTWDKEFNLTGFWGLSAAYRMQKGELREYQTPITGLVYKASEDQRYELSLRLGKQINNLSPYLKLGAILGDFTLNTNYATFRDYQKKLQWGGVIGGGVDVNVTDRFMIGGLLEFDKYRKISGSLANTTGSIGSDSTNVSALNALVTLTYKLKSFSRF
ncbi:MAG: hypothetical protein WCG05_00995 [Alphaproteobacteria bacterium]